VDHSRADFDRTHVFTAWGVWDLPFGRGQRWASDLPGFLNHIVGGWSATTIVTAMTGEPWGSLSGSSTNGNIRNSRADIRGPKPQPRFQFISRATGPVLFNLGDLIDIPTDPNFNCRNVLDAQGGSTTSYFCIPAPGSNGNLGRNVFNAPNFVNVDLGIMKNFNVTERWKIQFRAEFFNAFNHPNFDTPLGSTDGTTNFQSTFFGQTCCSSVSTPSTTSLISIGEAARVIQFALKIMF